MPRPTESTTPASPPRPLTRHIPMTVERRPAPRIGARPGVGGGGRAGGALTVVGVLLVLYGLFQMWGTALVEWQAQRALDAELAAILGAQADDGSHGRSPSRPKAGVTDQGVAGAVEAPPTPAPAEGAVLGRIEIPSIGVSKVVVEGVRRDTLRLGPGHYPGTALPGRSGNAAIAGHRTTYGAPFVDLDRLQPGDTITVETTDGRFSYVVEGHDGADGRRRGHRIVDPSAVEVLADHGDNRLTLTACDPRFSARQRIVVTALLVGPPAGTPTTTLTPEATAEPVPETSPEPVAEPQAGEHESAVGSRAVPSGDAVALTEPPATAASGDALRNSFGWQLHEVDSALAWATISLLIGLTGRALRRRWSRRAAYALAAPLLTFALFHCFLHLDRLLPAF